MNRATALSRTDLHRSLQAIGAVPPAALFDELAAAYAEPHRHYHGPRHLAECLAHLDRVRGLARAADEVAVALWFHDAVYDPRAGDNEERSAAWAAAALGAAGAPAGTVGRVVDMVLATRHHLGDDPDATLLLDIDLGILGAPPDAFARYDRAIRAEYHWLPEPEWRTGRARVLATFLERPVLYRTAHFRDRLETRARQNLAAAIAQLRSAG